MKNLWEQVLVNRYFDRDIQSTFWISKQHPLAFISWATEISISKTRFSRSLGAKNGWKKTRL